MKKSTKEIVDRVNADFATIYKPFTNFPTDRKVWTECMAAASNPKLMNNVIFCNDILQIPPVKVFLLTTSELNFELSDYQKKGIGAFWGFIFKVVFGYESQKSVSVRVRDVKSATFFYGNPDHIEIEDA